MVYLEKRDIFVLAGDKQPESGTIPKWNDYLKNNNIFKSKGFDDNKEVSSRSHHGHNIILQFSEYKRSSGSVILRNAVDELPKKFYNLAKKIDENIDLFCQLELLIRKIPVEDTKNIDLKLIIQNFTYYSSSKRPQIAKTTAREIVVSSDSPLMILGCVAQILMARRPQVVIECTPETAPVCSLFTDLCHVVGLKEEVLLAILPRISENNRINATMDLNKKPNFMGGGVGIVSGKSDVDSAVDTFLSSSCRYPWALKKIFVQECVLERFKKVLTWKSEMQAPGCQGDDLEVSCAASYRCGDKVFALEATGESGARVVALEAYRTVRELLVLLGALRPLAASLWSSDVAESLEIVHGLSSTIVWVNNFADFRGPPRVSQAFYSVIDSDYSTEFMQYMPEFDEITKCRESWLRLGVDERKDIVRNALSKIDKREAKKTIEDIETLTFEMDSFVYVTKDMVLTGVELLPEIMLPFPYSNNLDLSIISYIIKGGAVLQQILEHSLSLKARSAFYIFHENLRILGAPVLLTTEDYKLGTIPILRNPIYRHKVIWTSYGTVFAN